MTSEFFSLGASEGSGDKIVINVGGVKYETHTSTLKTHPGSRLAKLLDTEKPLSELFFDRNPEVFAHVLQYYRSGKLHCPNNLCGLLLEEEFAFWGVSSTDVEPCCWAAFQHNRDTLEALTRIEPAPGRKNQSSSSRTWQQKIWAFLDDPYSSIAAKVVAIVSLSFVLLSIASFSVKTEVTTRLSRFSPTSNSSKDFKAIHLGESLDVVEVVCSTWFMFEFAMRALSCPSKLRFFANVMNIVDLLALFPLFSLWCPSKYCWKVMGFLHTFRCVRLFRVFKLVQHVFDVRVLIHALRASVMSLCTIPLVLFICTLIFATMFFFIEVDAEEAHCDGILSCSWWAGVTLTTVGYGDIVPITPQGKFLAFLCAMVGVMLIVMPVPIIVNNFIKFSSLVKTKYSMSSKKEKNSVDAVLLTTA